MWAWFQDWGSSLIWAFVMSGRRSLWLEGIRHHFFNIFSKKCPSWDITSVSFPLCPPPSQFSEALTARAGLWTCPVGGSRTCGIIFSSWG